MNQKESNKKIYDGGVQSKNEMNTVSKKNNKKNTINASKKKRLLVYAVIVFVIMAIAVFLILKNADDKPNNQNLNYNTEELFGPERGSLEDRMTIDGKRLCKFYLGKFKDIEGYSEHAQTALDGSIEFWIVPSKDASRISYIEIRPVFSSAFYIVERDKETDEWGQVGPCIFDRGRQWYNPYGDGMLTTDWSPTSTHHKVRLTPKAGFEASKLLKLLSLGKISEYGGQLYVKGRPLTDQEIMDMIKFGILTNKNLFSKVEISEGYNEALEIAEKTNLNQ